VTKKSPKRIASVWCGIGLSLSALAMAQDVPQPGSAQPPEHPVQDENGVDVQTQVLSYTHTYVSIGPPDHRGLQYTENTAAQGGAGWFSFNSYLTNAFNNSDNSTTDFVVFGDYSDNFFNGTGDRGDGSYGSGGGFGYKDGTLVGFGQSLIQPDQNGFDSQTVGSITYRYLQADSIQYPDGVIASIHYKVILNGPARFVTLRIQSVTTNTGYQLKYYYYSDDPAKSGLWIAKAKVVAINNAYEYCNPDADSCALSSSWPTAQFAGSLSNGVFETDNTDAGGAQMRWRDDGPQTYISLQTPESGTFSRQYTVANFNDPVNSNPLAGPVTKVTQASVDGRVTNYAFSYSGSTATVGAAAALGDSRTYVTTANSGGPLPNDGLFVPRLASFTNGLNAKTQYGYDVFNRLSTVTSPEGNSTVYEYDNGRNDAAYIYGYPAGNITKITVNPKPGSGQGPMSESWTYPPCSIPALLCGKPVTFTDFNGKATSYTYDSRHGGLLTETRPADSRGIQPVKRYVYQQRSARYLNASGAYVAGSPIWVLTEEHTCMNSATINNNACAGGANDEVVTTYDYGPDSGPNNLLLRGKVVTFAGQTRRTCYGHDKFGNEISETEPRAGLTSCP
jgi:YD repeat-containing protein